MPIHDWTRVSAGTWHAFHLSWIAEIRKALNRSLLPSDYYAQAEQIIGPLGPDVLTLQTENSTSNGAESAGGLAVALAPPRATLTAEVEMNDYMLKRRTLIIRHSSDDQIVALLEIVPPGNKRAKAALRSFVEKAVESLYRGYHLLIIDLFPPGPRDPQGIHGAIWGEISDDAYEQPSGRPLTLVAYSAGSPKKAYIVPTAVADDLKEMPLFLEPEFYVNVPLESTYAEAFRDVPRRWKAVLEGSAT